MTAKLDGGRPEDEDGIATANCEVVLERAVMVDTELVKLDVGAGMTTPFATVADDVVVAAVVVEVVEMAVNPTVCLVGANGPAEDGPLYPLDATTAKEAKRTPTMTPVAKFTLMGGYPRSRRS